MGATELLRRFMLALCVWREARGESDRGMQLVAATILNRVADKRWPNSITGVVTQRLQFSSFNLGDPNALLFPQEGDASWSRAVAAADAASSAAVPLTKANHYHTAAVLPAWADPGRIVAVEGHHIFYEL